MTEHESNEINKHGCEDGSGFRVVIPFKAEVEGNNFLRNVVTHLQVNAA